MRIRVVLPLIVCIVVGIAATFYLRQPEPEIVSPSSTPEISKSSPQITSKFQTNTSTSLDTDSTKEKVQAFDWQNDVELDNQAQILPDDLWTPFHSQDTKMEDEKTESEENETKTDPRTIDFNSLDPYESIRRGLVEKYGYNTPEVQTFMEAWLKNVSGHATPEDLIRIAEATYALYPHPQTYRSLQLFKAVAAGDTDTLMQYAEPVKRGTEPFGDVQHFFEKNSHAEAFRKLRAADPKRAFEFEKFLMEQTRNDPSLDIEKITRAIERSYETSQENK